jgi:glycosidase
MLKRIVFLFIFSAVCFQLNAQNTFDKVEPSFWWVGMQDSALQIMVHGDEISDLTPEISNRHISLNSVSRTENSNYIFLNLSITSKAKPGIFKIDFLKKGKKVGRIDYELKQRSPSSRMREGFNKSDVIYLISPDRFVNALTENDHIEGMRPDTDRQNPSKRHGGDLEGIISRLDYIEDMGFSAIWICPLLESNQKEYSYHGYATTDYYKIDPRYGTNEDYVRLVKEAKKRGIKIIMDQVLNHNGSYHYWTDDLPSEDWYHYAKDSVKPMTSHKRTVLSDPYVAESDRIAFSNGWFVDRMPDLNQQNKLLSTYLIQNAIFWIEYSGIQGIRQDTYSYPDPGFMNDWSSRILLEYPNFNLVGEEWSVNPAIVSRWQLGKQNTDGFESNMPSMMDFPLQKAIVSSINKEEQPWINSFDEVYEMMGNDFLYPDPNNLVVFLDNHDMARIYDQVDGSKAKLEMALTYLYSTRGIPQVYYGTEIMLSYPENPGDHGRLRIDMPGGWNGDAVNAFDGSGLSEDQIEIQGLIKKLNLLRRNNTAFQTGQLLHYAPEKEVYVLFRFDKEKRFMIVFNKNNEAVNLDLSRFSEGINGNVIFKNAIDGKSVEIRDSLLSLKSFKSYIFELKP